MTKIHLKKKLESFEQNNWMLIIVNKIELFFDLSNRGKYSPIQITHA